MLLILAGRCIVCCDDAKCERDTKVSEEMSRFTWMTKETAKNFLKGTDRKSILVLVLEVSVRL